MSYNRGYPLPIQTITPDSGTRHYNQSPPQYPTYTGQSQYQHTSTLQLPSSRYGSTSMSRGYSSSSTSSSNGQYSDITAASSPPEDPQSPQRIEVVYAPATTSRPKNSSSLKPSSTTTIAPKPSRSNPPAQYPCLYPGCSYISGRPFDLERHMKKHNPRSAEEKLSCPGKGCGRVGQHGFDRKDHMTEHLRNYHCWDIPKTSGRGGRRRE